MRFGHTLNQKVKIATLLFAVMVCIILIRILEDRSVKSMNESFVSLYSDRLIPAADLFYLAENANIKKSLVETALYDDEEDADVYALSDALASHNVVIDSLIRKYERTYLVKQEMSLLKDLKLQIAQHRKSEANLLTLMTSQGMDEARESYEEEGRQSADLLFTKLSALMGIQKQVGLELMQDSAFIVSGTKLYSAFQVGLAVVIGILIVGIVFTSNVVKLSNERFRMN